MTFMQVIEFKTSRYNDVNELVNGWMRETEGKRTATHAVMTSDRDRPGSYLEIVEFPSYDAAMANSNLPETGKFAARMNELCDEPPVFHNLDVMRDESL
ncbi:hypothetical protein ABZ863_19785 [Saccharomonospora sp. NPDC046836]|uniref:hypothetical protein n=1 Tax=Saccharomonospora sp. NPDC046836 TaxID=3156921 RepID=UPI0034012EA8